MPRRGSFWGQPTPAPDDEPDPLPRADEQAAVFMRQFDRWLTSPEFNWLDYLVSHPRPEPDDPHDPALD